MENREENGSAGAGSSGTSPHAPLAGSGATQADVVLKNLLDARKLGDEVYDALNKADLIDLQVFSKLTDKDIENFCKPFSLGVCIKIRECVLEVKSLLDSKVSAAEVRVPDISAAESGASEVCAAEVNPVDIVPAQTNPVNPAEVDPAQGNPAAVNSALVNPADASVEASADTPSTSKGDRKRSIERILVPDSDAIDLESILSCYNGQIVREHYQNNKSLDKTSRGMLVRLIVDKLGAEGSVLDIKPSWYKPIHEAVIGIFPAESSLYKTYERLISQTKYNLNKKKKRVSGKVDLKLDDTNPNEIQADEPAMQTAKTWLLTGLEPDDEVISQWHICFKLRQAEFKSSMNETISSIFEESNWPILGKPIGLRLIKYDFDRMFTTTSTIFKKWPLSKPKILRYATQEFKSDRNKALLTSYNGNPNDVTFSKILCALLPAGYVCKKLRANAAHTERGFVQTVKTMNDVEREVQSYRVEMAKFGLTVQPHVIAITNESTQSFLVYIDQGRMYITKTLLEAIDATFKLCMVLSAKYPAESKTVWTFVQKHFYGVQTDSDREFAVVSNLMSAIEKPEQ